MAPAYIIAQTQEAGLSRPSTLIEYKRLKFLVFASPSHENLNLYLKEFKKYNVKHVARVCEPTYSSSLLEASGISTYDFSYKDGTSPPAAIVSKWLSFIRIQLFEAEDPTAIIGIHCHAGLGRAPVLVAIALIEQGMSPLDSVLYVRERRKGAFNNKQILYLESYRPQKMSQCVIC
ncbi:hypothetical protein DSO57_1027632 [Entomophthora muscae]|uniref:Uncharacterized protein n=1 Tax=Entomophthora muscae TaxID=34485 RepID=A0ACC2T1M4_9FUNG|nr:hypothetical protein DSO57_1027632 [Entomophthora muscae]